MRKALIAIIAAAVLFTVGAFAASLTVNSDNVASGEADVGSCALEANVVAFGASDNVTGGADDADWNAESATIELIEASPGACDGAEVDIALRSDGDGWTDQPDCSETDIGSPNPTYLCDFDVDLPVRPIVQVAVLVNGNSLEASLV